MVQDVPKVPCLHGKANLASHAEICHHIENETATLLIIFHFADIVDCSESPSPQVLSPSESPSPLLVYPFPCLTPSECPPL